MARVFVDTNVLFPFSLMDLMLSSPKTTYTTWSGVTGCSTSGNA
jgi:hypothetical protein